MQEQNAPYEPDDDELASGYTPEPDPISAALGTVGFVDRPVVAECVETFPDSSVKRFPERFDRLYWEPERILIDILQDGTPEMLERDRASKRVDFKTRWCGEHDCLYLVIPESAVGDAHQIRELLRRARDSAATEQAPANARKRAPAKQKRGQISRPKATA